MQIFGATFFPAGARVWEMFTPWNLEIAIPWRLLVGDCTSLHCLRNKRNLQWWYHPQKCGAVTLTAAALMYFPLGKLACSQLHRLIWHITMQDALDMCLRTGWPNEVWVWCHVWCTWLKSAPFFGCEVEALLDPPRSTRSLLAQISCNPMFKRWGDNDPGGVLTRPWAFLRQEVVLHKA